jgi:hypothetical protein
MSKQVSPMGTPPTWDPTRGLEQFNGAALSAWLGANEAYGKMCSAVSREFQQFVNARMDVDSRYMRSLSECQDLTEMAKAHQNWAMTTTRDYLDEVAKLWRMTSELSAGCMPLLPAETPANRAAEKKAA